MPPTLRSTCRYAPTSCRNWACSSTPASTPCMRRVSRSRICCPASSSPKKAAWCGSPNCSRRVTFICGREFSAHASLTHELLAGAAEAEFLADIDELNAPVHARRRMRRIAQLLLAHANRFQDRGIDPERIDQGIADRLGAPLAQAHIILAAADRVGMADDEETIAEQD